MLMDDIRQEMTRIGKQFINDGQPHGRHSPDTITCLRLTMQAALQELVNQRRIENFDIHDATTPTHAFPVMEVVIAPTCSVERIVVDVAINP